MVTSLRQRTFASFPIDEGKSENSLHIFSILGLRIGVCFQTPLGIVFDFFQLFVGSPTSPLCPFARRQVKAFSRLPGRQDSRRDAVGHDQKVITLTALGKIFSIIPGR